MEKLIYRIIALFLLFPCIIYGQERAYSMEELLSLNKNSIIHQINTSDSLHNSYNNRLFYIKVLPKVSMSATLPSLNNNISSIALEDGREKFVNRFYMSSSVSFSMSQFIPFTGGSLYLSSSLSRLDNFSPKKTKAFNLNLFNITYSQGISVFNSHKWEKKILLETNKLFDISAMQNIEKLHMNIVESFFDLYAAQKEEELNKTMISHSEIIYKKAKSLYESNRISKVSLLNAMIDLSKLKSSVAYIKKRKLQSVLYSMLNLENYPSAIFDFEDFINIKLDFDKEFVISRALHYGHNASRVVEELQEIHDIKKQKAAGFPTISLSVGGGINSQAEEFKKLTGLPSNSMSALFSISVPILSWGENRTKIKLLEETAKINRLQHIQAENNLIASYHYELDNINYIYSSVIDDCATLEMLYLKLEQLLTNFEYGTIDFSEIESTRAHIIQTEIQRISKVKIFYMTVLSI